MSVNRSAVVAVDVDGSVCWPVRLHQTNATKSARVLNLPGHGRDWVADSQLVREHAKAVDVGRLGSILESERLWCEVAEVSA